MDSEYIDFKTHLMVYLESCIPAIKWSNVGNNGDEKAQLPIFVHLNFQELLVSDEDFKFEFEDKFKISMQMSISALKTIVFHLLKKSAINWSIIEKKTEEVLSELLLTRSRAANVFLSVNDSNQLPNRAEFEAFLLKSFPDFKLRTFDKMVMSDLDPPKDFRGLKVKAMIGLRYPRVKNKTRKNHFGFEDILDAHKFVENTLREVYESKVTVYICDLDLSADAGENDVLKYKLLKDACESLGLTIFYDRGCVNIFQLKKVEN